MVLVEHVFGVAQVVFDLGLFAPGQTYQHIDVVAHHGRLGGHGRHQFELLQFTFGLLQRFLGHLGEFDLFLDLLDVSALFTFTQLLLDGLDLFIQVEVALVLLHLPLDTATDLFVDIQDVNFTFQLLKQVFQAQFHIRQIQNNLFVVQLQWQMRSNGVGKSPGIVDAGNGGQNFWRNLLVQFDVLVKLLHHRTAQGLDFTGFLGNLGGFHRCHCGGEVGFHIGDAAHLRPLLTFDQHLHSAVGQFEHLEDGGHTAHLEHVASGGFVLGCGFLRHQHDAAFGFHGQLKRLDALGTSDKQRNHHVGEDHYVTQRQQGQLDGGGRQRCMTWHVNPFSTR